MDDWQERRWLRRHAMVAPFGIFIATALLLYFAEQGQWQGRESWKLTATLVGFVVRSRLIRGGVVRHVCRTCGERF